MDLEASHCTAVEIGSMGAERWPKIWKVWTKIATAMMARRPATHWKCVRGHLSAVIVTLLQDNWIPIRHTSWKDPEGHRWSLNTGGVGIDDWGFWQTFRASVEGNCGRRLPGMNWKQVWKAEQTSPRCSNMVSSWRKGACMQPEACCWQRLRRRAGRRSFDIEKGWWNRRCARDARKRTRSCIIEFGNVEPTQVRSLTRHSISSKKPPKPKNTLECYWLVPRSWTLQDTKLGFWRQFGNGVLTRKSGAWCGLQSLFRACQTVGMLEATQ